MEILRYLTLASLVAFIICAGFLPDGPMKRMENKSDTPGTISFIVFAVMLTIYAVAHYNS